MEKKGWLLLGILTGVIGSFYEFVPRKIIKSVSEFLIFDITVFGYRIRHNDLILFGAVLLTISFVCLYKIYKLNKRKKKIKN